jgi:hypothetical protein
LLKKDRNYSPNSHLEIWRPNGLRTSALLGVISDIHRVHTNLENLLDVTNEPQQDNGLQAIWSSNFWMWIWGLISITIWENLTWTKPQYPSVPKLLLATSCHPATTAFPLILASIPALNIILWS